MARFQKPAQVSSRADQRFRQKASKLRGCGISRFGVLQLCEHTRRYPRDPAQANSPWRLVELIDCFVAMLEIPPVVDAATAVRGQIAKDTKTND